MHSFGPHCAADFGADSIRSDTQSYWLCPIASVCKHDPRAIIERSVAALSLFRTPLHRQHSHEYNYLIEPSLQLLLRLEAGWRDNIPTDDATELVITESNEISANVASFADTLMAAPDVARARTSNSSQVNTFATAEARKQQRNSEQEA